MLRVGCVLLLSFLQLASCEVGVEFTITKDTNLKFDTVQFLDNLITGNYTVPNSTNGSSVGFSSLIVKEKSVVKNASDVLCIDGKCIEEKLELPPPPVVTTTSTTSALLTTTSAAEIPTTSTAVLPVQSVTTSALQTTTTKLPTTTTALQSTTLVLPLTTTAQQTTAAQTTTAQTTTAHNATTESLTTSTTASTTTAAPTTTTAAPTTTTAAPTTTPLPAETQGGMSPIVVVGVSVGAVVVIAAVSIVMTVNNNAKTTNTPKIPLKQTPLKQAPPPPTPKLLQIKIDWPYRIPNATKTDFLAMEGQA